MNQAIEAVVRHALEKDVAARTPSVGEFLIELRNAVNSTPQPASGSRDTGGADANRTLVSQPLAGCETRGAIRIGSCCGRAGC